MTQNVPREPFYVYDLVALRTLTVCDHHHHPSSELPCLPQLRLCPHETLSPHPLVPSALSLYGYDWTGKATKRLEVNRGESFHV